LSREHFDFAGVEDRRETVRVDFSVSKRHECYT